MKKTLYGMLRKIENILGRVLDKIEEETAEDYQDINRTYCESERQNDTKLDCSSAQLTAA